MSKCRICLQSKRNVCSIFETDEGLSYASMISIITGIKVAKQQENVLCLLCRRKLKDLYEFKVLIERSDLEISNQSKVLKFNSIDDIKVEFLLDLNNKEPGTEALNYDTLFKNKNEPIYYNNTLIRKVKEEKKYVEIEEFLNTIKSESFEDNDCGNNVRDVNTDEEYNYKRKRKISKMTKHHETSTKNIELLREVNNICVKPILLNDIRLIKKITKCVFKKKKLNCEPKNKKTLCPFCGKITNSSSMKIHILTHTGEKNFKCHKCLKPFFTKGQLQYHMKSHSTMKQTFKCEHCISTFPTKGAVMRHMVIHMNLKEFSCTICKKAFKRKSAVKRHMVTHDMAGKSVQCDVCKMLFHSQSNLKNHSRVHTGERPYRCEICSQPYSYKRDFNRHCLKKHGVLIDRRPVSVMNEEVLKREKALMKDLMLHLQGIPTVTEPMDSFNGPQKALAFEKAVKMMQNGRIPIDVHL